MSNEDGEVISSVVAAEHPHRSGSRQDGSLERGLGGGSPDPGCWLAALVAGSDDAIVGQNLDGVIEGWNAAATRLFGYSADEALGRSIRILIPEERSDEEEAMLTQVRRGESVARFETKRRRKDGSLVDISLIVSVIRNEGGVIVGACKVARDITERLMEREQQRLLLDEMRHRVKNLFALAGAIVSISAKSAGNESAMIDDIRARLVSLARAHELTMADRPYDADGRQAPSLLMLIDRILDPYAGNGRVTIRGHDREVGGKAVTYLTLLLHELATNAAKFGSLSVGDGGLDVSVAFDGDLVRLVWCETGGPAPATGAPAGFGSRLEQSLTRALGATIERDWRLTGLVVTVVMPSGILAV